MVLSCCGDWEQGENRQNIKEQNKQAQATQQARPVAGAAHRSPASLYPSVNISLREVDGGCGG
jgi:hypothetical protein